MRVGLLPFSLLIASGPFRRHGPCWKIADLSLLDTIPVHVALVPPCLPEVQHQPHRHCYFLDVSSSSAVVVALDLLVQGTALSSRHLAARAARRRPSHIGYMRWRRTSITVVCQAMSGAKLP